MEKLILEKLVRIVRRMSQIVIKMRMAVQIFLILVLIFQGLGLVVQKFLIFVRGKIVLWFSLSAINVLANLQTIAILYREKIRSEQSSEMQDLK